MSFNDISIYLHGISILHNHHFLIDWVLTLKRINWTLFHHISRSHQGFSITGGAICINNLLQEIRHTIYLHTGGVTLECKRQEQSCTVNTLSLTLARKTWCYFLHDLGVNCSLLLMALLSQRFYLCAGGGVEGRTGMEWWVVCSSWESPCMGTEYSIWMRVLLTRAWKNCRISILEWYWQGIWGGILCELAVLSVH